MKLLPLHCFAPRIGSGLPEFISHEELEFYYWLAQSVYPVPRLRKLKAPLLARSFTVAELLSSRHALAEGLEESVDSMNVQKGIVVVHIRVAAGATLPAYAQQLLYTEVLKRAVARESSLYFLIVDHLTSEKEIFHRLLSDVVESGRVALVGNDGMLWAGPNHQGSLDPAEYLFRLTRLQDDALERIRQRLLRYRGHYRRKIGGIEFCTRFVYDGALCVEDIWRLLIEFYENRQYPELMVFDADISGWCEDAALSVAMTLGIDCLSIEAVLDRGEEVSAESLAQSVLILPLVDSGTTLQRHCSALLDIYGDIPRTIIAIMISSKFAQVSPEKARPFADQSLPFVIAGEKSTIYYCVLVERGLERSDTTCRLCREINYRYQYLESGIEMPSLRSYHFWEMILKDVGFKGTEDFVPPNRGGLPDVPNITRMLGGEDGGWITALAYQKLAERVREFVDSRAVIFVGPDQPGARVLMQRLEDLTSYAEYVAIPTKVLDGVRENQEVSLGEFSGEWWQRLSEASDYCVPIICEEFCVSGGTALTIFRLLEGIGKSARAHLVAVDFMEGRSSLPTAIPRVAAYELDFEQGFGKNYLTGGQ